MKAPSRSLPFSQAKISAVCLPSSEILNKRPLSTLTLLLKELKSKVLKNYIF